MTTDGHQGEIGHQIPNYIAIFWWLLGLTLVELGWAVAMEHSKLLLASGLVITAVIKAVLVAMYFMHLKMERKLLGILFASTLILGAILVSVGIGEQVLPRP
jgi:cytochrome c oxidase subunit 4